MFYYIYILYSLLDHKFYIGFTSNLKQRFKQHQNGEVFATKGRRPFKLIYYEAYLDKLDALKREKYFKTDKGKRSLRLMLKNYLHSL